jgi:hypothetical protein
MRLFIFCAVLMVGLAGCSDSKKAASPKEFAPLPKQGPAAGPGPSVAPAGGGKAPAGQAAPAATLD